MIQGSLVLSNNVATCTGADRSLVQSVSFVCCASTTGPSNSSSVTWCIQHESLHAVTSKHHTLCNVVAVVSHQNTPLDWDSASADSSAIYLRSLTVRRDISNKHRSRATQPNNGTLGLGGTVSCQRQLSWTRLAGLLSVHSQVRMRPDSNRFNSLEVANLQVGECGTSHSTASCDSHRSSWKHP